MFNTLNGLKLLIDPLYIHQQSEKNQFLIYKFISRIYEKNFGMLMDLASLDPHLNRFFWVLMKEGYQSTYSNIIVHCSEMIEKLFNYTKSGSAGWKKQITQVILEENSYREIKTIIQCVLRSVLRKEKVNLGLKIDNLLRLNRILKNEEFMKQCIAEVADESGLSVESK
mmetsp:Transcript_8533/g.7884  ORF Transcript_8533/g.7884 Transcript_8533/m.7884 type:complete len:169 (+) Transcript_8533:92-598(+)